MTKTENTTYVKFINYASDIVALAADNEEGYSRSDVMNGLIIASSCTMIDNNCNEDGTLNELDLHKDLEMFIEGIGKAVRFAKEQMLKASEAEVVLTNEKEA